MSIRRTAVVSVATMLVFVVAPASSTAAPRVDKRLCGVVEQGFTPLASDNGEGPGVTVGVAVRNRTKNDAVQVELRVNAYDLAGKLLGTQEFGLQNVPARQTVVDGYSWGTAREVGSIKVLLTCDTPSGFGVKRLPKYQRASATLTPDGENRQSVNGVFRNTQRTAYFYNVFFVVRDVNNKIVGGSFSNVLGTVPKGEEIAWESWIPLPASIEPLSLEANTSSVYSAF